MAVLRAVFRQAAVLQAVIPVHHPPKARLSAVLKVLQQKAREDLPAAADRKAEAIRGHRLHPAHHQVLLPGQHPVPIPAAVPLLQKAAPRQEAHPAAVLRRRSSQAVLRPLIQKPRLKRIHICRIIIKNRPPAAATIHISKISMMNKGKYMIPR